MGYKCFLTNSLNHHMNIQKVHYTALLFNHLCSRSTTIIQYNNSKLQTPTTVQDYNQKQLKDIYILFFNGVSSFFVDSKRFLHLQVFLMVSLCLLFLQTLLLCCLYSITTYRNITMMMSVIRNTFCGTRYLSHCCTLLKIVCQT